MAERIPLATREVRWFFEGAVDRHGSLKRWFEEFAPFERDPGVGPPVWRSRLGDQPDIYILVPSGDDMGIKWREGELQIKGRVSCSGTQIFCGRHQGKIERWVKWSYAGIPAAYRQLFTAGEETGLLTAAVRKTRALRKLRLDTFTGEAQEIDPGIFIDRGLHFDLTNLGVAGKTYCSLAVEAYPDDSAMDAAFTGAIEAFLNGLAEPALSATQSQSYPSFLRDLIERTGRGLS
jgi:hypothetical protein